MTQDNLITQAEKFVAMKEFDMVNPHREKVVDLLRCAGTDLAMKDRDYLVSVQEEIWDFLKAIEEARKMKNTIMEFAKFNSRIENF